MHAGRFMHGAELTPLLSGKQIHPAPYQEVELTDAHCPWQAVSALAGDLTYLLSSLVGPASLSSSAPCCPILHSPSRPPCPSGLHVNTQHLGKWFTGASRLHTYMIVCQDKQKPLPSTTEGRCCPNRRRRCGPADDKKYS